ncbi:type IV toxin-antitoxin system AbiEi family antitoxin domain-containing protein [Isoptericola halotolerans]|uniref:AbiEi antitoxin N-terminal domain-containing protein n=1 Tax=Isoptericola halotolerans TaxID=300560 RepID=A0ABX2A6M5_9MICO|nr:type IV toxin-antitoxin system AbiEi family antitoxin domain-containing protein [Isoptericola halotolerans]NOV98449.1 hypothetical protein [Isoptericola halotolerans]
MPTPRLVVPTRLLLRAQVQEGLVSVRQARAEGMTDAQLHRLVRSHRWLRVARGVYDTREPGILDLDPYDRRRRRAAVLGALAHPGSIVTGVAALVLHGVQGAPTSVTPEVTMPDRTDRKGSGAVRVRRVTTNGHVEVHGLRSAMVADALVQAVPTVGRRHAVALMDSARQQRLIDADGFALAAQLDRRRPGGVRRRGWWQASRRQAESPAETWARLTCTDRGVRPDVLQLPVDDASGRQVARVDLAWLLPDGGALLVEIDGRDVHDRPDAVLRDRDRQNRLAGRRSLVLRFTGREAWDGTAAARVAAVLEKERWHPQRPPATFRFRPTG